MADFAMCLDKECPSARTCRRSAVSGTKSGEFSQCYHVFPRKHIGTMFEEKQCEGYWPVKTDSTVQDGK